MIKPKEIQDNNIHYRKTKEYIQSDENNSRKVAIQVLAITLKKEKINIIRSCNIVNKILRLIFPS